MELTKEYFDKAIKGLATKKGLELGLEQTEQRIIRRIDESQEELARIIANTVANPFTKRFEHLEEQLVVKNDVQVLKHQMKEIRSALHLGA